MESVGKTNLLPTNAQYSTQRCYRNRPLWGCEVENVACLDVSSDDESFPEANHEGRRFDGHEERPNSGRE